MLFGLTRGEILLIVFVFALVYLSGLLPRLVKALSGDKGPTGEGEKTDKSETSEPNDAEK